MSAVPDTQPGGRQRLTRAQRRERGRLIVGGVIGALVTAFALLNLGDVKVDWLVASGQTPLILVILVAFLFGMAFDRLVIHARRRRRAGK